MSLSCPAAAHFGVPKNRQQPMPCTHSSPCAQWYPGMVPVAGESPPSRPSIPCRPGTVSLPFLVPSQSISAGQPSGGDGQQLGQRDFTQHPHKGSPQDGLGCPRTTLSLLFPLEMDSVGFRERCQCGRGDREKRSSMRSIRTALPKSWTPFPLAEPLDSVPVPRQVP